MSECIIEKLRITLRARSHQAKANAKAKRIKEQANDIKEKFQTSKKIFAFAFARRDWALKHNIKARKDTSVLKGLNR